MSHVHSVTAFHLGNPVLLIIHVEPDDSPRRSVDGSHRTRTPYTLGVHRSR